MFTKNLIFCSFMLVSYTYSSGIDDSLDLTTLNSEIDSIQTNNQNESTPLSILGHLIQESTLKLNFEDIDKSFLLKQLKSDVFKEKELSPYLVELFLSPNTLDLANPDIEKELLETLDLVCNFVFKNNLLSDNTNVAFKLTYPYFESFFVKGSPRSQMVLEKAIMNLNQKYPDHFTIGFFTPYILNSIKLEKYNKIIPLLESILSVYNQNEFVAYTYAMIALVQSLSSQDSEWFLKRSLTLNHNSLVLVCLAVNYFVFERYQEGIEIFNTLYNNFNDDLAKTGLKKDDLYTISKIDISDESQLKVLSNLDKEIASVVKYNILDKMQQFKLF